MTLGRRIVTGACLLLAAVTLAIGAGAAGAGATTACDRPCGGGASVSQSPRPSSPPCIRDVSCSGAITLASGSGLAVAFAVPAALSLALLPVWRRRRSLVIGPVGRVLATGLFRPPRILPAA